MADNYWYDLGFSAGKNGDPRQNPASGPQMRKDWDAGWVAGNAERKVSNSFTNGADRARLELANKCSAAGVKVENADSIPRDPSTDKVVKQGKDYKILETKPFGPGGKYQEYIVEFKAGGPRTVKDSLKAAIDHLKQQGYEV